MLEKMGVSDPECDKVSGWHFIASALWNLGPQSAGDACPDLVVHRGADAVLEYHNTRLFLVCTPHCIPMVLEASRTPLSTQHYHLSTRRNTIYPYVTRLFVTTTPSSLLC
jgi:hypothetical protein